jgi:hypothetical protein
MWVRLISYLALGTGSRALMRCLCKRYVGQALGDSGGQIVKLTTNLHAESVELF